MSHKTDDELIIELQTFYTKNQRSPTTRDFLNKSTYSRRFGSWNEALKKAQLPITVDRNNHWDCSRKNTTCKLCGKSIEKTSQKVFCEECGKDFFTKNMYAYQKQRSVTRKIFLIQKLGNKCNFCGYDHNLSALNFHHLNDKSFPLDQQHLSSRSLKSLLEEVKKCILLCSNCHLDLHHPSLINWQQEKFDLES